MLSKDGGVFLIYIEYSFQEKRKLTVTNKQNAINLKCTCALVKTVLLSTSKYRTVHILVSSSLNYSFVTYNLTIYEVCTPLCSILSLH